ncbi:23S rRNA (adenine(2503)-C(2))-methyltransferase RlmN [candidate division KSB1 bacterium]|nr:MAG: 23S rRNA (adenine(2503)-C(2))-methyltransferase RlmN [candidate division KSB1 bacterium]
MPNEKSSLIGLTRGELESFVQQIGEPAYRGRQLYDGLYRRRLRSFAEMTDLPLALRTWLSEYARIGELQVERSSGPAKDHTRKFLLRLDDGLFIESVFLPESPGQTVCISSQVGCAIGCTFCATGKMGFSRNLTAAEIILQVLEIERLSGTSVTNIVLMGMGEPLHNYENVVKALKIFTDSEGMSLSPSRITVSTVGIIPMIERWCAENPPAKLAISLHATTDERRDQIVPANRAFPLEDLMKSLRRLAHVTRFPVTFEYIMIADFNDRREDAANLRHLLRNIPAKMNLIRLHPTGSGLTPSSDDAIDRFMGWLVEEGIDCTVRESRGVEDSAACGMLYAQEPHPPLSRINRDE